MRLNGQEFARLEKELMLVLVAPSPRMLSCCALQVHQEGSADRRIHNHRAIYADRLLTWLGRYLGSTGQAYRRCDAFGTICRPSA